jgi:hypothetical protein
MESLSNIQIEIKNALESIIDLTKKTDDRFHSKGFLNKKTESIYSTLEQHFEKIGVLQANEV